MEIHFFEDSRLSGFSFRLNDISEFGYSKKGDMWFGKQLSEKRQEGLVSQEFPKKAIFSTENCLLGRIEETPDGSWWAHGPYYPDELRWIDVFGFSSEFYAVRYLCQIVNLKEKNNPLKYPEDTTFNSLQNIQNFNYVNKYSYNLSLYEFNTKLELSFGYDVEGNIWHQEEFKKLFVEGSIINAYFHKEVFLENSIIGFIKKELDGTWLGCSLYSPPSMEGLKVRGFRNDFYAALYIHLVVFATYPESLETVPPCLPWEQGVSHYSRIVGNHLQN